MPMKYRRLRVKANKLMIKERKLDKRFKQTQKHTKAFEFVMDRVRRAQTLADAKAIVRHAQYQYELGVELSPTPADEAGRSSWL